MLSGLFVPDTIDYMIAGYLILTLILSGYMLSIYLRWKSTKEIFLRYKDQEK